MRRVLYLEKLLFPENAGFFRYLFTTKVAKKMSMGRRKFIGRQFSGKYQPAKKIKTEEKTNENSSSVGGQVSATATPESVFIKFASEIERIDKLSRECKRLTAENTGLKRTIQTLRKSIDKRWLRKKWVNDITQVSFLIGILIITAALS